VDEEAELLVVGDGVGVSFGVELGDAGFEGVGVAIIVTISTVIEHFGCFPSRPYFVFADVEEDGGAEGVVGFFESFHDNEFFVTPATNGTENQRLSGKSGVGEVGEDNVIEFVGRSEDACVCDVTVGAEDSARAEELRSDSGSKASADGVFAAHGQAEDVDRAGVEPCAD